MSEKTKSIRSLKLAPKTPERVRVYMYITAASDSPFELASRLGIKRSNLITGGVLTPKNGLLHCNALVIDSLLPEEAELGDQIMSILSQVEDKQLFIQVLAENCECGIEVHVDIKEEEYTPVCPMHLSEEVNQAMAELGCRMDLFVTAPC